MTAGSARTVGSMMAPDEVPQMIGRTIVRRTGATHPDLWGRTWITALLVVAGCTNTVPTVTPAPAAITISGARTTNSEPFTLGGNYSVTLSAKVQGDSQGCYTNSSLKRTDGSTFFESLPDGDATTAAPATGATILYNLASADYYVDANSGCDWSYTFTPY